MGVFSFRGLHKIFDILKSPVNAIIINIIVFYVKTNPNLAQVTPFRNTLYFNTFGILSHNLV